MTPSKGLRQAYEVQDLTFTALQSMKQTVNGNESIDGQTAAVLTRLVAAWSSAQERIAFHRRVPSPGSLRPEARKAKRPRRAAPLTATVAPATPASDAATIPVDKLPAP